MEAPSKVRSSEPVSFTLKVKNVSDHPIEIERGNAPKFMVTNSDGAMVWDAFCSGDEPVTDDKGAPIEMSGVTDILLVTTVGPGEELVYKGEWKQWDNEGEYVTPGDYLVYGILSDHWGLVTEPITITIVP